MRRGLWIALGLGLGVGLALYAVRRLDKAAQTLSPQGLGQSVNRVVAAANQLAGEVKAATAQREAELRSTLLHGEVKE